MTRQKKNKVRIGRETQKENANEIRKQGIEALGKPGIRAFMTEEEWEKEPDEYKLQWGSSWLKKSSHQRPSI